MNKTKRRRRASICGYAYDLSQELLLDHGVNAHSGFLPVLRTIVRVHGVEVATYRLSKIMDEVAAEQVQLGEVGES